MSQEIKSNDRDILSFQPVIEYVEPPPEAGDITPITKEEPSLADIIDRKVGLRNYADAIDKLATALQAKADKRAKNLVIKLDPNIDAAVIQSMQRRFPGEDPNFITYDQYRRAKDDIREMGKKIGSQVAMTPEVIEQQRATAVQSLLDSTDSRAGEILSPDTTPIGTVSPQKVDPLTQISGLLGNEGEDSSLPLTVGAGELDNLSAAELAALGIAGGIGGISGGQNVGNSHIVDNKKPVDGDGGVPSQNKNVPRRSTKTKPSIGGYNDKDASQGSLRPELDNNLQIVPPIKVPEFHINLLCILINLLWKLFIYKKLKNLPVVGSAIPKNLCDPGFDFAIPGLWIITETPDFPPLPQIPVSLGGK